MTAVLGQAGPVQDTVFPLTVQLRQLDAGIEAPSYAKPGDAGADLRTTEHVILAPGERKLVPTGIAIALPMGYVGLIHPRSGLAAKHGLTVVNTPGTVDAGYRGEIKVCLLNTDKEHWIELGRGDRIAQLVIQRVETAVFEIVDELPASDRGDGGFGSTGGFNAVSDLSRRAQRLAAAVRVAAPETGDRTVEVLAAAFTLTLATPGISADDLPGLARIAKLWIGDSDQLQSLRGATFATHPETVHAYQLLQSLGSAALTVPRNRLTQLVCDASASAAWKDALAAA